MIDSPIPLTSTSPELIQLGKTLSRPLTVQIRTSASDLRTEYTYRISFGLKSQPESHATPGYARIPEACTLPLTPIMYVMSDSISSAVREPSSLTRPELVALPGMAHYRPDQAGALAHRDSPPCADSRYPPGQCRWSDLSCFLLSGRKAGKPCMPA